MDRDLHNRLRARAAGRRRVRVATTAAAVGGVVLTTGLGVAFAASANHPVAPAPTPVARPHHSPPPTRGTRELQPPVAPPAPHDPTTSSVPDVQSGGS